MKSCRELYRIRTVLKQTVFSSRYDYGIDCDGVKLDTISETTQHT